jgi:hypothetical protein
MMRTRRGEQVNDIHDELTPDSSHVKEGFYYPRLKRYYDLFPSDQIKIYIFEEFKQDPTSTIIDLFDFLNVSQDFLPDTSVKYNPAGVPRNRILNRLSFDPTLVRTAQSILPERVQKLAKDVRRRTMKTPPKFPPDLRAELIEYYRSDIHQLEELIDRDLSIWLN